MLLTVTSFVAVLVPVFALVLGFLGRDDDSDTDGKDSVDNIEEP